MKMLGKLGWFGQCSCCNGPRGKREMKRYEQRQWERDAFDYPQDYARRHEPLPESTARWLYP
jgi:hypothetical protein